MVSPSPSGPSNTAEYLASGLPYATRSIATASNVTTVTFPFVTKFVTVKNNSSGSLQCGFTRLGTQGSNYFTLNQDVAWSGDIRVGEMFFTAASGSLTFEVVAGLTQIPHRNWFILTGAMNHFSGTEAQIIQYGNRGFGYPGIG